jgi:hypothetical protein
MGIDINKFGQEYDLKFETFQAGDRRIRLAIANKEPVFEDSREYILITGTPLLCPLNSGEWALVTSQSTARFEAGGGADAVDRAKRILVDKP